MSSERCNSSKTYLICSFHVSLGLPLPLLPSTVRVSTTLTGVIVSLRFTCPNHFNLPSLIFSDILVTPNIFLKTSFLFRSNIVCPHIHISILISATSILCVCVFLIAEPRLIVNLFRP
ncbi:hypothetical protein Hdeb2414_s0006g00197051 [Helianthus debilis subsp. tardiflorus]